MRATKKEDLVREESDLRQEARIVREQIQAKEAVIMAFWEGAKTQLMKYSDELSVLYGRDEELRSVIYDKVLGCASSMPEKNDTEIRSLYHTVTGRYMDRA